ncbi:ATP-binding protein [Paeniglutamicibacter sulfureus]|uniref:ATP-binding protein n=1 Tax=Paeniglutamicibacter sulfureus TaxID=43666 RepID=UPI0026670C7B|nr:ATP-binding protein [Paeniglutamicibacter sulfureus]MDO2932970.1 ATP-binding protein [Paeniglutamicibacter sulfureus]MDO2935986.1 ATP-binding protein [Paeniglutamicibacter sulfureus]
MFSPEAHEKFKALRITRLASKFEELANDEANHRLTAEELFHEAADDMLTERRSESIAKRSRQAGFPIPGASLAEIDYLDGRSISERSMNKYATHQWSADPMNLIVISPSGGGKTYLVCAIGNAACQSGHTVSYSRMDDLARKLVATRSDAIAHQELLNKLTEVDLLVIDDFLTVGIDQNAASDLFAILADREHRLPTVIAAQTDPSYWVQALPDRVAADSIVNRLANNTRWILMGDRDMRRTKHDQARASEEFWE